MARRPRARRIAKWAWTVAAAAATALWAYSHFRGHRWIGDGSGPLQSVRVSGGSVEVNLGEGLPIRWYAGTPPRMVLNQWQSWENSEVILAPSWRGMTTPFFSVTACVPFWLLLALFGLPAAYLWRGDGCVRPGRCGKCGYDLAGLGEGSACPECGVKA